MEARETQHKRGKGDRRLRDRGEAKGGGGGWMSPRAGERRGVSKRELAFLFPFLAPFFRIRLGNTNGHHLEIVPPSLHHVPTTHGLARLVPVVGGRGGGGSSYSLPGSLTRPPPHPSLSFFFETRFPSPFLARVWPILEKSDDGVSSGCKPWMNSNYHLWSKIAEKFDAR